MLSDDFVTAIAELNRPRRGDEDEDEEWQEDGAEHHARENSKRHAMTLSNGLKKCQMTLTAEIEK